MYSMWYSIGLSLTSLGLYLFHYLVGTSRFKHANEITSLLMGIALIGMILSGACFFMNVGNYTVKKKKKFLIWMCIAVLDFLSFLAYIVICLFERARIVGISF